jgi:chromo domain-containing protein 1
LLNRVRVWSFGYQEGVEYDTAFSHLPFDKKHHCIELFPAGGLIYITDDVFETKPRLALDIVKLFLARIAKLRPAKGSETPWQDVDNINLHWRLCVRPELMEYIYEKCEEQSEALDAGDPDVQARAELYTLLSDTNYIEQDSPVVPLSLKADKYPIMSECRDVADEEPVAYFRSLAQSREKANLRMIRFYAGLHVDSRRDYRHFYIVHTDCSGPSVEQWQREVQTLTGIMTPEECIKELSKDGADAIDQKIDFYEHYLLEEE